MTSLTDRFACARTLRFEREPPARIDAIVIVGSTCTGKTTLASAIRDAALAGVDVPQRFVTRPAREDDVAAEARKVTAVELDAAIASGAIELHWSRVLEPGRTERYAFASPAPGSLPVYSANNAIYRPGNVRPPGALAGALLVGVFAPEPVREQRLHTRSPGLWRDCPTEARARLADGAESMRPHVHVVVENHGSFEPAAPNDFVALVRAIRARQAARV